MTAIAEKLDRKLADWKPQTASEVAMKSISASCRFCVKPHSSTFKASLRSQGTAWSGSWVGCRPNCWRKSKTRFVTLSICGCADRPILRKKSRLGSAVPASSRQKHRRSCQLASLQFVLPRLGSRARLRCWRLRARPSLAPSPLAVPAFGH